MYNHMLSTNRIFVVNILLNGALQYSMQPYLRFQGEGEQSKQSPVRSHYKEAAASVDTRSVQSFTGLLHHERCRTHTFIQRTQSDISHGSSSQNSSLKIEELIILLSREGLRM